MRTGNTWYTQLGDGPFIWLLVVVLAASILLARRDQATGVSGEPHITEP